MYCDKCHIEFPTVTAFELHYDAIHRNVCSVCNKIFPAASWLQLHLDEFHDTLLQIKKDRGEKIVSAIYNINKYIHPCFISTNATLKAAQSCSQHHVCVDYI
jgi:hypothetical protein